MADKCGNCDCADKAQCVKGSSYTANFVEIKKNFVETVVMGVEGDGKCKCVDCKCVNCSCGD